MRRFFSHNRTHVEGKYFVTVKIVLLLCLFYLDKLSLHETSTANRTTSETWEKAANSVDYL